MIDTILFNEGTWVIFLMPFLGLLVAGFTHRQEPEIRGDKILRHDVPARVAHWSHAIGTVLLLVSGFVLGSRITPALVGGGHDSIPWFNVHFVFACLFLFGTFYWVGNTIVSTHRLREHLPTRHAFVYTLNHYGSLMGFKRFTYPREEKYFESERMAFVGAVGIALVMAVTGMLKVLTRCVDIPGEVMLVANWAHDIAAVLMLLFLLAHVFFAVVIPSSWPTFPSMLHGTVSLEHAREEHAAWVEELEKKAAAKDDAANAGKER